MNVQKWGIYKYIVPGWVVERRTILAMKDSLKGTEVGNYRPIACLNLILKPLKRIIIDKTYDHLEENRLLPEEQKKQKTVPRDERSAFDRKMHIAKVKEQKDKFKHGLGGLQKCL